jgi:hypothetical protein
MEIAFWSEKWTWLWEDFPELLRFLTNTGSLNGLRCETIAFETTVNRGVLVSA